MGRGTALRADSATTIIVGRIIIASSTDAESVHIPRPPKSDLTIGTIVIMPKNPYTTLGMPAISVTAGRTARSMLRGLNAARNTAVRMPTGTPRTTAPAVTAAEPASIGRIPKLPSPGRHEQPARKRHRPILPNAGVPSTIRKRHIVPTAAMASAAAAVKTILKVRSIAISFADGYLTSFQRVILPV